MKIHLRTDVPVTPKRILTARQVPHHMQAEVDKEIDRLLANDIIAKVDEPTPWISPAFFVPKHGSSVRLVTDYTALNVYVRRPVHPFASAKDILDTVSSNSKVFAVCDCTKGYFQIPLDHESSLLTTMMLPRGRFRYKRAPMGLSSSSDEWCARSDTAIQGLPGVTKLVDDILVQAPNTDVLLARLKKLFKRCEKHGITLSKNKLQISDSVNFAGHVISATGIRPSPDKLKAISNFPAPANLTDLRSFLGLANQLGRFHPDIAQCTSILRDLLKGNVAFNWMPEHQRAFEQTCKILSSPAVVHPFNPQLRTELLTDASRLHGIGYALVQWSSNNEIKLVHCGSRSLTAAEKNYSTIELELLALVWATEKSKFYLFGSPPYQATTDHKPLQGLFAKDLQDITNTRLQRLRERLTDYSFTVNWVPGKTHQIADALSRAPVFEPDATVTPSSEATCNSVRITRSLQKLVEAAHVDKDYQEMIKAFQDDRKPNQLPHTHPALSFRSHWDEIAFDNGLLTLGNRIIVPTKAIKDVLNKLHLSHSGIAKTKQNARQLYYWPNMNTHIEQLCAQCPQCREKLPSQPREPLKQTQADAPMESVSLDLFSSSGKDYLTMVDRYSGYIFVARLHKTHTQAITDQMWSWFRDFGLPTTCRSDGGPQFRGEFAEFCQRYSITHEVSSPYNPQSNGHAEAAVKNAKYLLEKHNGYSRQFEEGLLEWRNTPRSDGFSPAQMLFGYRQRTQLPALASAYQSIDQSKAQSTRRKTASGAKQCADKSATPLDKLQVGTKVLIQNPSTKRWTTQGTIGNIRPDGRSYSIQVNGHTYIRNRRLLRPLDSTDHTSRSPRTRAT